MPAKKLSTISTILTVLILLVIGLVGMFFLLVALNGFSEREGTPALVTSLVCNGIAILLAAVLAWRLPGWLIGKFNWNNIAAVAVSVLAGLLFGSGLSLASAFIGVIVATALWESR